nr:MAG TPA: hypothetical protein [Caudoviricetes sp.]
MTALSIHARQHRKTLTDFNCKELKRQNGYGII